MSEIELGIRNPYVRASFGSLPIELQHHVFTYVYPLWHLEYTQEHDQILSSHILDKLRHFSKDICEIPGRPLFSNLPSIGPLLACRTFYDAGRRIFLESFTEHVYITSKLKWNTVHSSYEGLMRRARFITLSYSYLDSFLKLDFIKKFSFLSRLTIVADSPMYVSWLKYKISDGGDEEVLFDVDTTQTQSRLLDRVALSEQKLVEMQIYPLRRGLDIVWRERFQARRETVDEHDQAQVGGGYAHEVIMDFKVEIMGVEEELESEISYKGRVVRTKLAAAFSDVEAGL